MPVLSDPSAPASKRSRSSAPRTKATYATGSLKEAQERALNRVKELKCQYAMTKVNPAKMHDWLQKSHGSMVNAEMTRLATVYTATVKKLDPFVNDIRNWTVSTMSAGTEDLEILASDLHGQWAKLMEDIDKVKQAIKAQNIEKYKKARIEMAIRERAIRPFLHAGTPSVLAKWLFLVGAINSSEEDGYQTSEWNFKMTMDILGEDFDERVPAAWSPNSCPNDVGSTLRNVIPAYGSRIEEASADLIKILDMKAISATGDNRCVVQVTPKGGQRDTVESMSWAPKAWMKKGMAPDALRSFGSPWLVAGLPGSSRIGSNNWPVPGMGQFLIQMSGSSILATFPYQAAFGAGGNHGRH